jgi:hypothetical protein
MPRRFYQRSNERPHKFIGLLVAPILVWGEALALLVSPKETFGVKLGHARILKNIAPCAVKRYPVVLTPNIPTDKTPSRPVMYPALISVKPECRQ